MVELRGLAMVLAQASCDLRLKEALKAQKEQEYTRPSMCTAAVISYLVDRLGEQTGLDRQRCCRHTTPIHHPIRLQVLLETF